MSEQRSSVRRQPTVHFRLERTPTEGTEGKDNIDETSGSSDRRIASSVKWKAKESEGATTKEDDVPREHLGGTQDRVKAQNIIDELNKSKGIATKIAEKKSKQMLKLKQQVNDMEKHLGEQRALKLENQTAEIARLQAEIVRLQAEIVRLQTDLLAARQQLRASSSERSKSAGFFSHAKDFFFKNTTMTDVQGDYHLHTDREKSGNGYLL